MAKKADMSQETDFLSSMVLIVAFVAVLFVLLVISGGYFSNTDTDVSTIGNAMKVARVRLT